MYRDPAVQIIKRDMSTTNRAVPETATLQRRLISTYDCYVTHVAYIANLDPMQQMAENKHALCHG